MSRLPVSKTYKLYIGGAFPRSESGRTYEAQGQNVARASRKDVRDAVRAARGLPEVGRADRLQPRSGRLPDRRDARGAPLRVRRALQRAQRGGALDRPLRLVRRLGRQARAGARLLESGRRAVFQLHGSGADGVVGIVAPEAPALAGLVSRLAPAIVGGNAVVVLASEASPLAAVELAEVLATSDVPGGVVNLLTGHRDELAPILAGHMDVNAIDLAGADGQVEELERLAADNVKRVVRGSADGQSPWEIASFLDLKTVWHPIGV